MYGSNPSQERETESTRRRKPFFLSKIRGCTLLYRSNRCIATFRLEISKLVLPRFPKFTHWLRANALMLGFNIYSTSLYLFCQIHLQDSGVSSMSSAQLPPWFSSYKFWFMISLLAKHRARLGMRHTRGEVSNDKKRRIAFNCAHRQLHCRPSQGPSPPASRPLRPAALAEPRAGGSQNQDNADISYPKRDATRICSISLASLWSNNKPKRDLRDPPPVDTDRIRFPLG
jgi:hypothetical protein